MFGNILTLLLILTSLVLSCTNAYSSLEDARIIAQFKKQLKGRDHAKIARNLVHEANWAAMGTISTNDKILGYPMVNIISIDDSDVKGQSTGEIHFLLTDLDFTGNDWKAQNKVTLLFSDEQNLNCKKHDVDPMEPTCPRTIISGQIKQIKKDESTYNDAIKAFINRHPASENWMAEHNFYLCELDIDNIFVLDFYGGPHNVAADEYYKAIPDINNLS